MPLEIKKRGRFWYIRGSVCGESVYFSTGTDNEKAAEEMRIKEESRILAEKTHGPKAVRTFAEAAKSYIESGGSEQHLSPIIEEIGFRKISGLKQADLDSLAKKLYPDIKPQSLNRKVYTPVIAIHSHAAKREWCEFRRWERPRVTEVPIRRWGTKKDLKAMYDSSKPHIKPLIVFLVYTGCRKSEAFRLEWKDVDLKNRWAVIGKTKTGRPRGVPLNKIVISELKKIKGKGRVFKTHKGKGYGTGGVKTSWRKTAKKLKNKLTPHDLRRTCATWLQMAGVPREVRQDILGHSRREVHDIYAQVPQKQMIQAVDKLKDFR